MGSKLKELGTEALPDVVKALMSESDRGAVVLAGSYIENLLGVSLRSKFKVKTKKLDESIFGANGALSTFSQRIDICESFGFIKAEICTELKIVKSIRNEFAHHPFDARFKDQEIDKLVKKLQLSKGMGIRDLKEPNESKSRQCYLSTCGSAITYISAFFGEA
ncbi:MAG TPA: hypothetical protein VIZ65_00055 [Cellvibrionaceae bacterium]